ncbi:MAG: amidohydrolase, partial [Gammaproteobacteria bacterium]
MCCAVLAALLPGAAARAAEPADTLYLDGIVQTLDASATRAEAVAVRGGRILATGSTAELQAFRGPATRVVALAGRALLPGFVDGHSHLGHALQFLDGANLSEPPVGAVRDVPSLRDTLRRHARALAPAKGEWIVGYGYSRESLAEGRELDREDLDADFPVNPVMVLHVSGHGAVFNSAAFRLAGVHAKTPDPAGGLILRRPGGSEPAGLVMETALFPFMALLPRQDAAKAAEALRRAQALYAANGYTTIQDGATDPGLLSQLRTAAAEGRLFLDVVALPVVARKEDFPAAIAQDFGRYEGGLKLGGIKVLLDGSPQARTAWFTRPYLRGGPGGEKDWRGKPFMAPDDYLREFGDAWARHVPVWTHANGDAAI